MILPIPTTKHKRCRVFEIIGRVDSSQAFELSKALDSATNNGEIDLILDLSRVEYLSNAGLNKMVHIYYHVKSCGGDLKIANPSRRAREVFELTGLDKVFEIFDTLVDAIGSF